MRPLDARRPISKVTHDLLVTKYYEPLSRAKVREMEKAASRRDRPPAVFSTSMLTVFAVSGEPAHQDRPVREATCTLFVRRLRPARVVIRSIRISLSPPPTKEQGFRGFLQLGPISAGRMKTESLWETPQRAGTTPYKIEPEALASTWMRSLAKKQRRFLSRRWSRLRVLR